MFQDFARDLITADDVPAWLLECVREAKELADGDPVRGFTEFRRLYLSRLAAAFVERTLEEERRDVPLSLQARAFEALVQFPPTSFGGDELGPNDFKEVVMLWGHTDNDCVGLCRLGCGVHLGDGMILTAAHVLDAEVVTACAPACDPRQGAGICDTAEIVNGVQGDLGLVRIGLAGIPEAPPLASASDLSGSPEWFVIGFDFKTQTRRRFKVGVEITNSHITIVKSLSEPFSTGPSGFFKADSGSPLYVDNGGTPKIAGILEREVDQGVRTTLIVTFTRVDKFRKQILGKVLKSC